MEIVRREASLDKVGVRVAVDFVWSQLEIIGIPDTEKSFRFLLDSNWMDVARKVRENVGGVTEMMNDQLSVEAELCYGPSIGPTRSYEIYDKMFHPNSTGHVELRRRLGVRFFHHQILTQLNPKPKPAHILRNGKTYGELKVNSGSKCELPSWCF